MLRAQATLANLRERYILQQDRFKIRLGLDMQNPLELGEFTLEIPTPAVSQTEAVERALLFRLDLQNRRDQLDDRRRAVRNAKNALLPTLDLSGQLIIPTPEDDPTGGLAIDPDELNYAVEMSLGLPLDREIERLGAAEPDHRPRAGDPGLRAVPGQPDRGGPVDRARDRPGEVPASPGGGTGADQRAATRRSQPAG